MQAHRYQYGFICVRHWQMMHYHAVSLLGIKEAQDACKAKLRTTTGAVLRA